MKLHEIKFEDVPKVIVLDEELFFEKIKWFIQKNGFIVSKQAATICDIKQKPASNWLNKLVKAEFLVKESRPVKSGQRTVLTGVYRLCKKLQ